VDWEAAARVFNVSHVTLRQFMQYRGRCRPRTDTLTSIAARIGCSVADFLDDPGDAPPSIPPDRWSELSERERALTAEMLTDMAAADLTLTEKEELLLVHREAKARLLRMRK
jgi:transcriptional regulator with XRE-family HTH domain